MAADSDDRGLLTRDRRSVVASPAGMGDETMKPTQASARPETIEHDERPVHQWRLAQLASAIQH